MNSTNLRPKTGSAQYFVIIMAAKFSHSLLALLLLQIGEHPVRFPYLSVPPCAYGLTTEEILSSSEKELNRKMGLKCLAPYAQQRIDFFFLSKSNECFSLLGFLYFCCLFVLLYCIAACDEWLFLFMYLVIAISFQPIFLGGTTSSKHQLDIIRNTVPNSSSTRLLLAWQTLSPHCQNVLSRNSCS